MKRGPIAIETMSATSAATRTLLTQCLGHDLEPNGTRALHEDGIARPDELSRDRDRLRGRGRPRIRVVAPGQLADSDHERKRSCCAPDLLVVARRVGAELGHVAEDRDRPATVCALPEMGNRGLHRDRVRVPGVVDEKTPTG